jgi:hypothetical protein
MAVRGVSAFPVRVSVNVAIDRGVAVTPITVKVTSITVAIRRITVAAIPISVTPAAFGRNSQ